MKYEYKSRKENKRNEPQTEEYTTDEMNNIKKSHGMTPNEGVKKDIENKNRCKL
jgi:hypothetical protein